eukprot:PITA_28249
MVVSDEDTEAEIDVEEDDDEDDTSAAEVKRGEDIQGLPWQMTNMTRQEYRDIRMKEYENMRDVPQSQLDKICANMQKGGNFYEFQRNTKSVKPTYSHFQFQLRELVWATSKHDVYLSSAYSIIHRSAVSLTRTEFLNARGPVVASEIHPWAAQADVSYCSKISENEVGDNASTNSVEIYKSPGGATRLITASNDCDVRVFDLSNGFARIQHFSFPWAVNRASVSPDNKLFVVVGDGLQGFLSDCQTGKVVATLQGHLDYSFASAWHPNGTIFATGNQDTTCRLWDVRNTSTSLEVLKGNMAAILSIRFSSDGQFMAMAEEADFVHIFDTKHMYNKRQENDFFGDITGISYSPDPESFFIGVHDEALDSPFGSLLEYKRRHQSFYLDSLM